MSDGYVVRGIHDDEYVKRNEDVVVPELREVLLHTIDEVYFCEHRMDNTFVRCRLSETEIRMKDRRYIPEGVCLHPQYSPQDGYALKFLDENGDPGWVHVPKFIMHEWLKQIGITPPEDVPWDDDAWKKHVWKMIY